MRFHICPTLGLAGLIFYAVAISAGETPSGSVKTESNLHRPSPAARNPFVDPTGPLVDPPGTNPTAAIDEYVKSKDGWIKLEVESEWQPEYWKRPDGKFVPGYSGNDEQPRPFCLWKGVVLDPSQIPREDVFVGNRAYGPSKIFREVVPPVQFLIEGPSGSALAGYLDGRERYFYAFSGVAVPLNLIPPASPQHRYPLVPDSEMKGLVKVFIPVPAHLKRALAPWTTETPTFEEKAGPFFCATHFAGAYEVDLAVASSKNGGGVQITLKDKGKSVCSFEGHEHSVFGIVGDTLWYADFSPTAQGGRVIAVDLVTGKQLWSKELQGLPSLSYPAYKNRMNLDADGHTVTITGHETAGDYVEVLDADTGRQLRHVVTFPVRDKRPATKPASGGPTPAASAHGSATE